MGCSTFNPVLSEKTPPNNSSSFKSKKQSKTNPKMNPKTNPLTIPTTCTMNKLLLNFNQ